MVNPNSIVNLLEPSNTQTPFYKNLLESIRNNGILNPILLSKGHLPQSKLKLVPNDFKNSLICWSVGGSRLWAAKTLGIELPAIISDWTYTETGEILNNLDDIKKKFVSPPEIINIDHRGIVTSAHGSI